MVLSIASLFPILGQSTNQMGLPGASFGQNSFNSPFSLTSGSNPLSTLMTMFLLSNLLSDRQGEVGGIPLSQPEPVEAEFSEAEEAVVPAASAVVSSVVANSEPTVAVEAPTAVSAPQSTPAVVVEAATPVSATRPTAAVNLQALPPARFGIVLTPDADTNLGENFNVPTRDMAAVAMEVLARMGPDYTMPRDQAFYTTAGQLVTQYQQDVGPDSYKGRLAGILKKDIIDQYIFPWVSVSEAVSGTANLDGNQARFTRQDTNMFAQLSKDPKQSSALFIDGRRNWRPLYVEPLTEILLQIYPSARSLRNPKTLWM